MRIECENCHDVVEVTAKTVVAPFVCSVCVNDATPCTEACCTGPRMCDADDMVDGESLPSPVGQSPLTNWSFEGKANLLKVLANPSVQAQLADKGEYIDYTAVAAAMSIPEHDACDTASVENTTLLIEDLQQQLADERASIIALEAETAKLKQDYVERQTQIQNQADIIKEQEGHIDQDLRAIVLLMGERTFLAKQAQQIGIAKFELGKQFAKLFGAFTAQAEELHKLEAKATLLDERNLRQHKSIALYQEQEVKLQGQVTFWKAMTEKWARRAEGARDLATAHKGIIADLKRHPIREYFRNAWSN